MSSSMYPKHSQDAAREYKRKQVETAKPGQLIVMLYDATLESLRKAEEANKVKNPENIEIYHNALIKAQNIITELMVALDMEKGGEVANNLFKLYEFMLKRLVDANITKTVEPIQEVRQLLENLREAWADVQDVVPPQMQQKSKASINLQG